MHNLAFRGLRLPRLGAMRRGGGAAPTIASLFAEGQQGAWFDPSTLSTLFQDTDAATAVTAAAQSVARANDRSGRGNNATQATASKRLTYQTGPARLVMDKVDDVMSVTVPAVPAGGWTGTMVLGTDTGTASYGVTIPAGAYDIGGTDPRRFPGASIVGLVIRDGALTTEEKAMVQAVMVSKGAPEDYSAVTDASRYWQNWEVVTSFPALDLSASTNFDWSWEGLSSLISFPAVNLSSGTSFRSSWRLCLNLVNFPPDMFDEVPGSNFGNAFASTNLSETSIDRILASLAVAATRAVSPVTNGIFDQSGGSAPSEKTGDGLKGQDAIDTLRALGWNVSVTGGY